MDDGWILIIGGLAAWGVGVALVIALLRWLRRKGLKSAPWRLLASLAIVLILPFPIGGNNGHSEGWIFVVPIGLLLLVDLVLALSIITFATLLLFAIWSAIRGDLNDSKKSNLGSLDMEKSKCPACLTVLSSPGENCPKCGAALPKQL